MKEKQAVMMSESSWLEWDYRTRSSASQLATLPTYQLWQGESILYCNCFLREGGEEFSLFFWLSGDDFEEMFNFSEIFGIILSSIDQNDF